MEEFLTVTINFIDACSTDQIQLAPEKCKTSDWVEYYPFVKWMSCHCFRTQFLCDLDVILRDDVMSVNNLCRKLREHALQINNPMRAILPLQTAIRKVQPSSEYLTAVHTEFFLVCLLAKCYKSAFSILEEQIFEIDPKKTGLIPRDFLLYCYYG